MIGDKKLIGQHANEREEILVCKLVTQKCEQTCKNGLRSE